MSAENRPAPRLLIWAALFFVAFASLVSFWHWWTFQYGTFDLAFYVQSLWLALRGKWMVSLLNVPLMGNHPEPIVFLMAPLFAVCPHPMTLVAVQTIAFGSMPFTAWRIGQRIGLERTTSLLLALATLLTPASLSIAIYEFHPEALAAPFILLLIEARFAERRRAFWIWFLAVLAIKENMAPLLILFCATWAFQDRARNGAWQIRWNLAPAVLAAVWLVICGKVISPWLNAGNVDYLQLYSLLGTSGSDILIHFFTEPMRAIGALKQSVFGGNMVWALLTPLLFLPLLRPKWLFIASPVLLQHLFSWRPTEWSLGAHYPAPFIPLLWIAAAEAISGWRWQKQIAIAIVSACAISHVFWGSARELVREAPSLGQIMEEREGKAMMIKSIPDDASVTASLPYLSHLAKREHLVSLHHILKGLKTLSIAEYVPPPPGDVVVIDYGDGTTFSKYAGYYHPRVRVSATRFIASSDQLLHDYLSSVKWEARSENSLTVLKRGDPVPAFKTQSEPVKVDEDTTLVGVEAAQPFPGTLMARFAWDFSENRTRFPWVMLVLSDGKHLRTLVKGIAAPEANAGRYYESWRIELSSNFPPGYYSVFMTLYDGNEAAETGKLPPDDRSSVLMSLPLGGLVIKNQP